MTLKAPLLAEFGATAREAFAVVAAGETRPCGAVLLAKEVAQ
jgi:L-fucose mutarotase/ribose pyranase (RbsD/FucU family)